MINTQPPEYPVNLANGVLDVHSVFQTIQGEGPYVGTPCVFVRLAGCNLQCPACDTQYTHGRKAKSPAEILALISAVQPNSQNQRSPYSPTNSLPLVVITGGEPFRQNIVVLVELLLATGYRVQLETNGTFFHPLPFYMFPRLTVVCSPKTGRINSQLAGVVNAFKYVIEAGHVCPEDGLPLNTMAQHTQRRVARPPMSSTAEIFVQPLDVQDERQNDLNLQACIQSALRFGYRLCVQTHKIALLP